MAKGDAETRVGRGQAELSRSNRRVPPGVKLSNKAKLQLGKAAARNLMTGTIKRNLARMRKAQTPD